MLNDESEFHRVSPFVAKLDARKTLHGVGISPYKVDEQRGLRIGLRPTLLPILQRSRIGAEVPGEESPRDIPLLAQLNQLAGRDIDNRPQLHGMRPERALPLTRVRESRDSAVQIVLGVSLRQVEELASMGSDMLPVL